MSEPLDVIKFVCKDFWILIFKKQIDKLQTNHRVWLLRYYSVLLTREVEYSRMV